MDTFLESSEVREQLSILLRMVVATAFAAVIGFEREVANKPAGLRTHALLAAAIAMIVGLTDVLIHHLVNETQPAFVRFDPLRVVEAAITGVAFLGAGTIFRYRGAEVVVGLTTAASLLMTAAIAIAAALEQYILSFLATALALIVLRVLRRFE